MNRYIKLATATALTGAVILAVTGGTASAHHPEGSGVAACTDSGWQVTWTFNADDTRGYDWNIDALPNAQIEDSDAIQRVTTHGVAETSASYTTGLTQWWTDAGAFVTSHPGFTATVDQPADCGTAPTTTIAPTTTVAVTTTTEQETTTSTTSEPSTSTTTVVESSTTSIPTTSPTTSSSVSTTEPSTSTSTTEPSASTSTSPPSVPSTTLPPPSSESSTTTSPTASTTPPTSGPSVPPTSTPKPCSEASTTTPTGSPAQPPGTPCAPPSLPATGNPFTLYLIGLGWVLVSIGAVLIYGASQLSRHRDNR